MSQLLPARYSIISLSSRPRRTSMSHLRSRLHLLLGSHYRAPNVVPKQTVTGLWKRFACSATITKRAYADRHVRRGGSNHRAIDTSLKRLPEDLKFVLRVIVAT